jgi:hypothetical protein
MEQPNISTSTIQRDDPFLFLSSPSIIRDAQSYKILNQIYEQGNKIEEISQGLNLKRSNSTGNVPSLTYKKLQNWESEELVFPTRQEGGWRRYSIMDQVWIGIIEQARVFGTSLDILKNARTSLKDCTHLPHSEYPALEFYVLRYIITNDKFFLVIFHDGTAVPLSLSELTAYLQEVDFTYNSYILIDVSAICLHTLPLRAALYRNKRQSFVGVDLGELLMLHNIRSKNVTSVNASIKKGKKGRSTIDEIITIKKFNAAEVTPSDLLKEGDDTKVTSIKKRRHVVGYEQQITLKPSDIEKLLGSKFHSE